MRILRIFRPVIRASAFLRAEIFEILRQPRLILTLVLGPFLILLLFGIGYRNTARPLRTIFVVDQGDPLAQQIQEMAPGLGGQLIFKGVTSNKEEALAQLKAGQIDVVAVAPPHPTQSIENNQQAAFTLYHNEIDPTQVSYVQYFGKAYIDEVNRRVLAQMIARGTSGIQAKISPEVAVSPFTVQYATVASVELTITDFFAPAVIVLLLQHLAVTFGSLSIVREARLGTMELFRVSPLNAGETLIGKYLSYIIFTAVLTAILTGLVVLGLRVPMLGDWRNFALAIGALLFASLGYGFLISLASNTDSQAVQYAMLLLLSTVFFSGFFMRLETLIEPVRVISYLLPGTYGVLLLQDIMLRGTLNSPNLLIGLGLMGAFLFFLDMLLLRRRMARR